MFTAQIIGNIQQQWTLATDLYRRKDYLPDLDYNSGEAEENLLGIYERVITPSYNHPGQRQFALGTWVLGDTNTPTNGYFIGVNRMFHPSINSLGIEPVTNGWQRTDAFYILHIPLYILKIYPILIS